MRKFTYFTQSFAVLLLLVLSSCAGLPGPEPISDKYARPDEVIAAGVPVIEAGGTYIYSPEGGNFRYAGALFANADGTMSAWFTTPGGSDPSSLPAATEITTGQGDAKQFGVEGDNGALVYSAEEAFYSIGCKCPGWSADNAGAHFVLYEWQGSIDATLATSALGTVDFVPYKDNSWLELSVDNSGYGGSTGNAKFPAGTYMLHMTRVQNNFGFWSAASYPESLSFYKNGSQQSWVPATRVQFHSPLEYGFSGQIKYFTAASTDIRTEWSEQPDDPAVAPTSDGADAHYAKCASVVKAGNYYYMAYQGSTTYEENYDNCVFIARAATIDAANWEKWNGSGWGGEPVAVVDLQLSEENIYFGAGEPSLVVKDGTIYLYYTYALTESQLDTYLYTADATDENWPANMSDKGMVMDRSVFATTAMDGASVVYSEETNSFIGIHSVNNNNVNSYFAVWQSTDGITGWTHVGTVYNNTRVRARYPRFVTNEESHVTAAGAHFISYQYGESSSKWQTYMSPYTFAQ